MPPSKQDRPRVSKSLALPISQPKPIDWMKKSLRVKSWRFSANINGTISDAVSEDNVRYDLKVLWNKNDASNLVLRLQGVQNKQLIKLDFPVHECCVDCRLLQSDYTIDLRRFNRETNELLYRWVIMLSPAPNAYLDTVWRALTESFSSMSNEQVRYLNLPRASDSIPLALGRSQNVVTWPLLRLGFEVRFTGLFATPQFAALMSSVLGEPVARVQVGPVTRSALTEVAATSAVVSAPFSVAAAALTAPVTASTAPTPASAAANDLEEDEDEEEDAARESLRLRRLATNPPALSCGWCGLGPVPDRPASVFKRLYKKVWIGCENEPEECKSHNFWFHLKKECAGINANEYKPGHAWYCELCRVGRTNADRITGFERRPGARTGINTRS